MKNRLKEEGSIDDLYSVVKKKLFIDNGIEINLEIIKGLDDIKMSYYFVKKLFREDFREDGTRYLEHLKEVAFIIINELPNSSIEKVIIALLHDSIEDKEKVDFDLINKIFGINIALSVQAISKKPWQNYLTEEELEEYNKNGDSDLKEKGKNRRNEEYFGHMHSFETMKEHINEISIEKGIKLDEEKLKEITQNALDVKFADRIHNLRTQWDPNNLEKVKRKIEETEKYFLKIAKETNIKAYEMLKSLVFELRVELIALEMNVDCIK